MEMQIKIESNTKINAIYKGFSIKTDQSVAGGGENSAPAPFDLFLASIGTCAGFYIKSFCAQRNISTDGIKKKKKMHYNQAERRIGGIDIEVKLPQDFPAKYKNALLQAAGACAVKKHILNPPEFSIYATE